MLQLCFESILVPLKEVLMMPPFLRSQGQHVDALRGTVRPARLPLRIVEEDALSRTENAE